MMKINVFDAYQIKKLKERLNKWLFNIRHGKIHTEYYPSGKKKSKGCLVFDQKDGKWTYWHDNGQKRSKGSYLWVDYGKGQGLVKDKDWTYWHEDGIKKE